MPIHDPRKPIPSEYIKHAKENVIPSDIFTRTSEIENLKHARNVLSLEFFVDHIVLNHIQKNGDINDQKFLRTVESIFSEIETLLRQQTFDNATKRALGDSQEYLYEIIEKYITTYGDAEDDELLNDMKKILFRIGERIS